MYCHNCGNKLDPNSKFCPNCGILNDKKINDTSIKENNNTSLILGILAFIFILNPIITIPLAIIAIITSKKSKNKTGKTLGIVSLIFSILIIVLAILVFFFFNKVKVPIVEEFENIEENYEKNFELGNDIYKLEDNSTLFLSHNNIYYWYKFNLNQEDIIEKGNYQIYQGTLALNYLVDIDKSELAVKQEELTKRNSHYQIKNFYVLTLKSNQEIINLQTYYGFYFQKEFQLYELDTNKKFTLIPFTNSDDLNIISY